MKEVRARNFGAKIRREENYDAFDQLDGDHPWSERVPEGMIKYSARQLAHGKVSYFNFNLAKEMGLISKDHPNELTPKLIEKVLSTFNLRIINEYDQQHNLRYSPRVMKPKKYMATRYLQLQHVDKTGRTSGDGRAIWNGTMQGRGGKVWDVSSRGTGVTALAPGVVEAGCPLKSGNNDHGYGCGMAEIDELFGAAILAEIFHRNDIPTERVLTIIDLGKGVGIGVRASLNLLRPAHMFLFLKQGRIDPLRRALDYFIERQYKNKAWDIKPDDKDRYAKTLPYFTKAFAEFTAKLDRDYIFAWLDWDGDNVLADAGIIDYGSIRQFGLRHDQYRYDDVERWSTNLNEQKQKAREMLQTFAQLVHYAQTGERRSWRQFAGHPTLKEFDRQFRTFSLERFLYQVGFAKPLARILLANHRRDVEALFNLHFELESVKTHRKLHKVADGIHRPAIFNMRVALAKMSEYVDGLPIEMVPLVDGEEYFCWILSSGAKGKDRRLTKKIRASIVKWQIHYLRLLRRVTTPATWDKTTKSLRTRSRQINHEARITGNALIHIVDDVLRYRRRGLSDSEIQAAIEDLITNQTLNPDFFEKDTALEKSHPIVRSFLSVVHGFREDI